MARYLIVPQALARRLPALDKSLQRLEYLLFRGLFALVRLLSPAAASRLCAGLFRLLGPLGDKGAKIRANLRVALPDRSEQDIRRLSGQTFGHLGQAAGELVRMPVIWDEWKQRIDFEVSPASHEYLCAGGAAVYITAHLGPWQVTPIPIIRTYLERPILMVYTPESNPLMNRLMIPLRHAMGVELVSSRAGLRPLLKALQDGQSVGLAADTRLRDGPLVPFFGVPAPTTIAPARLALRTNVPLIPARGVRTGPGHFRVIVEDPIPTGPADAPDGERALAMTQRMNERFEHWISAAPEQWMCLKRRWPKPTKPGL